VVLTNLVHPVSFRLLMREPLVRFVLLGGLAFAAHALARGPVPAERADSITISAGLQRALGADFQARDGRSPTPDEMRALIEEHVDSEVLFREAVALGLDQGDAIIRRRLVQKMRFLVEDLTVATEVSEADLAAAHAAAADRLLTPTRTTLRQLVFTRDRHGDRSRQAALACKPADAGACGDPSLLPAHLEASTDDTLEATFGAGFAAHVARLPVGRWAGPVPSSYGWHWVHVDARAAGILPPLEQVRGQLRRELEEAARARAVDARLRALRTRYEVRVDTQEAAGQT
jgi:hypothetical protein